MRTVTLDGRRFPLVGVVCPPDPDGIERTDWNRSLGTTGDPDYIVPAENGLLFSLTRLPAGTWELWLHSPACKLVTQPPDTPVWLPRIVGLVDGALRVEADDDDRRTWRWTCFWTGADEDWLVEHMDRLSRMPVPRAAGPRVRLVDPDALQPDA